MNEEQKQKWLKSLKIGDSVCKFASSTWYDSRKYYDIVKVKSITKSGNIRLENEDLIKLGSSTGYQPITQEVILINKEMAIKTKLRIRLANVVIYNLDIEKVKQILEILGDEE